MPLHLQRYGFLGSYTFCNNNKARIIGRSLGRLPATTCTASAKGAASESAETTASSAAKTTSATKHTTAGTESAKRART